jgi:surfeit locus 1 family protein
MGMNLRQAVVTLASLAGLLLTARLGLWQLDRAAQKTAWQEAVLRQQARPPLPQAELADTPEAALAQVHRRITLRGRWLNAQTVWLENRQMNGRPGFYAVTPLLLAPGDAVLVQRGWAPRDARDRSLVPALPEQPGEVSVHGRVLEHPSRLFEFDAAGSGAIRQNLDTASYAREIKLHLRPLAVLQLEAAATGDDTLQRQWPVVTADVAKHHGYAFQWFALSALITGLYVWFQLIRPRRAAARRPAA